MCLYPRLIANPKYKANNKNGGIIPAIKDTRVLAVPIGCGKCIECLKKRGNEWRIRLLEEVRHDNKASFVTLTFNNEAIKKLYNNEKLKGITGYELENATATLAIRLWLERWRKSQKKSAKHWLTTELGHQGTENIHIHGIIWSKDEELIKKTWTYGWVYTGKYVNEKTVNYIIKYTTKIDLKHKYYKPKILTSAGIGKKYLTRYDAELNKYKGDETREQYITRQGTKAALPIYLRNKIYDEDEREKLWIQKIEKQKRYILGKEVDVSANSEAYYKLLNEARKKNERLGYGHETNWQEEQYENQKRTLLQNQRKANIKNNIPNESAKELWAQSSQGYKGITPKNEEIKLSKEDERLRNEMREWRKVMA